MHVSERVNEIGQENIKETDMYKEREERDRLI